MSKNGPKETINISFLNKAKESEDKSKQNDSNNTNKNNNISNSSKPDKNENIPKIISKKENQTNNNNDSSNTILNKKRERTQSHGKEQEEEKNNLSKRKMPLNEAKKEMKDFELLIFNTEKEIQKKYGLVFPDLSFEDNLPDEFKNKLIDNFLERPDIKKILNEVNTQK